MIDLEPKYISFNDCIENQIYTILNKMGYLSAFTYIDSLHFEFDIKSYNTMKWSTIGELIKENYELYIMNLSRFWNIEVQLIWCDRENLLMQINESLESGLPLIVVIDSYWCPWEVALYKKYKEFVHAFIIKDMTSDGYRCTDGHRGIEDCFISKDDLYNGYAGRIVKIRKNENKTMRIYWREMLSSAGMREISRSDHPSWQHIGYFKDAITNHLNMERELEDFKSDFNTINRAPIIEAIRRTKNKRKKYRWCIESISTTIHAEHIDEIKLIIDLTSCSADKWKMISVLLIKYFYSSDIRHKEKIISLIDEIIEIEKRIVELMIKADNYGEGY